MNQKQQSILLRTAKDAIDSVIYSRAVAEPVSDDSELNEARGCFVTLKNGERLRGCIGQFTSDKPLIELVSEMSVASLTHDPRFFMERISADELEYITIEISVLSPLVKTDEPLDLRLGVDGIYITDGHKSGCFLPQVAEETGWTKEEFLTHCCVQKAKLPPDAWKYDSTEVYLFSAEKFQAGYAEI
jgi:AmmeMemoRadiSam system protein A